MHIILHILHIIFCILFCIFCMWKKGCVHIVPIILHIILNILHINFHILHIICCIVFPTWAASGLLSTMGMSLSQQAKVFKHKPACAPPWTHCAWHPNQLITCTKCTMCQICKICKKCLKTLFCSQNCPSLNHMHTLQMKPMPCPNHIQNPAPRTIATGPHSSTYNRATQTPPGSPPPQPLCGPLALFPALISSKGAYIYSLQVPSWAVAYALQPPSHHLHLLHPLLCTWPPLPTSTASSSTKTKLSIYPCKQSPLMAFPMPKPSAITIHHLSPPCRDTQSLPCTPEWSLATAL